MFTLHVAAPERPNFNRAVKALIRDAAAHLPELAHVRPGRILVVAGEARRNSRGTVKPLCFRGGKSTDIHGHRKPVVRIKGKRMLYTITLRPLFFRGSSAEQRIETLLHELFHMSRRFDGTLHAGRRHEVLGPDFARRLKPMVRRYLEHCPPELRALMGHRGEVRVLQWLERPGAAQPPGVVRRGVRRVYTEEHLFYGVVRMVTPRKKPRVH